MIKFKCGCQYIEEGDCVDQCAKHEWEVSKEVDQYCEDLTNWLYYTLAKEETE